jgi:hypothetical protein
MVAPSLAVGEFVDVTIVASHGTDLEAVLV